MTRSAAEIESLLARPKAYYNIDGVGELGVGLMCLGFALIEWMQMHMPKDSVWNQVYMLFIYVGVMCSIIHYGSKAIKKHITYPRTGFVQYRLLPALWFPLAIALVVSAGGSVAFLWALRSHWELTTPVSLMGLLLAASYAYGIARAVRWKWIVVCAMGLSSLLLALLPADLVEAPARHSWVTAVFPARAVGAVWLTMLLYGTLMLISGGVSFVLYMRHTQPPVRDPQ